MCTEKQYYMKKCAAKQLRLTVLIKQIYHIIDMKYNSLEGIGDRLTLHTAVTLGGDLSVT